MILHPLPQITLIAALILCARGSAGADYQVGRYTTMQPKPTQSQHDVLATVISVRFDAELTTVGEAIQFVLKDYGYELSDAASADALRATLLSFTIPAPHRHLGPLSIREILSTLSGPSWILVEDPIRRLVSFERCM